MSDTPIADQVAAELDMKWPLADPDELHNPVHAPEVDQARLDAWRVTAARPPMHMAGQLDSWFTTDSGAGTPDGAALDRTPGTAPPEQPHSSSHGDPACPTKPAPSATAAATTPTLSTPDAASAATRGRSGCRTAPATDAPPRPPP